MIDSTIREPLYRELQRWRDAGRVARLWLRDDDAIEPTAALERLLAETKNYGIPDHACGHSGLYRRTARSAACG